MAKGKYETHVQPRLTEIQGWARNGLIDEQIASNLGIHTSTFYDYKNKHEEFSEALRKGKEVIDFEVENALLKKALGYEYTEVKTEREGSDLKITETLKEMAPDTTAQIFWLKNRKPKEWRDKHQVDQTIKAEVVELTLEQKEQRLKDLKERLDDVYGD